MKEIFGNKLRLFIFIGFLAFPFIQYYIFAVDNGRQDFYFTLVLPLYIGLFLFFINNKIPFITVIGMGLILFILMRMFYLENLTYSKVDSETKMIQNLMGIISYGLFLFMNGVYLIFNVIKKQ